MCTATTTATINDTVDYSDNNPRVNLGELIRHNSNTLNVFYDSTLEHLPLPNITPDRNITKTLLRYRLNLYYLIEKIMTNFH